MTREPVQVYHDPFGRFCLMREIEHDTVCRNCGGERAKGGAFRYGRQNDDSPRISWQNETFCCIECMRIYHDIPARR